MKFIIALFALIAVAAATPTFNQVSIRMRYEEVMQNKSFITAMAEIICAIFCEPFQIALDTIVNLGLQVILSLLALPPEQMGAALLGLIGK